MNKGDVGSLNDRKKYKSYDSELKRIVAQTGSLELASAYGVPRTTALYWMKNYNYKKDPTSSEDYLAEMNKKLEEDLESEKAKVQFLKEIQKINGFFSKNKISLSAEEKSSILNLVDNFSSHCSRPELLKLINLHSSTYGR